MAEKIGAEDHIKVAKSKLEAAEKEQEIGLHPSAVLDACFAIDNIVNALLIALGARPAKRHRWTLAITNAVRHRSPELMKQKRFSEVYELIRDVEAGAHIIRSRYPFTVGGQKFVPEEYYTSAAANEVVNKAHQIVSELEEIIERMKAQ